MKPGDIVWHGPTQRRLQLVERIEGKGIHKGGFDWEAKVLNGPRTGGTYFAREENLEPVPKHADPAELWRACSALYGLVRCTGPEHRAHIAPAIDVILSCLRAAGETCGHGYPEP